MDNARALELVDAVWDAAGLPRAATRETLSLSGDAPLLATSFHVGRAAQVAIAAAALVAAELGRLRGGAARSVSVDLHDAERECTGYFSVDGQVPEAWAPLSGLYRCGEGHVRIHANFDHHRDGALRLLRLRKPAKSVTKEEVQEALIHWHALEFEAAAAAEGLVVSALRTFEEWDLHPQAEAIRAQPLFALERIDDAAPLESATVEEGARALSGIRVLDLTRILAGPVCGRTLAAYGADVMLVNSPNLPNIASIAETSRGKRSCLIDLETDEGKAQLRALVDQSHVFVEGYRPGALTRHGFGPKALAELRPGIVYVSLSAYGDAGPWAGRRGFDSLVQTATGFNHAEALAAGQARPRPLPVQILDYATGFLMAFGASAALLRQQAEGGSWHVKFSLAQTAHWLRNLGRLPDNFRQARPDPQAYAVRYDSGFGAIRALPHAARFDDRRLDWERPSMPPGSHAPVW